MSLRSSTDNYKLAKKIYETISELFYTIENEDPEDEQFLIDQTLDYIKQLNRIVTKINLDELAEKYHDDTMEAIEVNVDTFKEASYYIERSLSSMMLFNKLNPILGPYMKQVNWRNLANTEETAAKKFGGFVTHEDNYQDYKNIINNIVKGTISPKAFEKIFNTVASRIPGVRKETVSQKSQTPPEMWDKNKKNDWEKHKQARRADALKNNSNEGGRSYGFTENFVSLKEYKLLLESLAYECQTCGERAEHEEIEDNPRMKCPNCGDSNWETEY